MKRQKIKGFLISLLLLTPHIALAHSETERESAAMNTSESFNKRDGRSNGESTNKSSNEKGVVTFEKFEEIALYGSQADYLSLSNVFKSHPLFPYAQASYLQRTLNIDKKSVINNFINQYANAPFVRPLEEKWLHYLHANNFQHEFIKNARYSISPDLDCKFLASIAKQLNETNAHTGSISDSAYNEQVTNLWSSPTSMPKSCDVIFEKWVNDGHRTSSVVLSRIQSAVAAGNIKLAEYLKQYVDEKHKYLAHLWIVIKSNPRVIYRPGVFLFYDNNEYEILKFATSKLAFTNPPAFYKWWTKKAKPRFERHTDVFEVDKTVAIALAVNKAPISLSLLNALPNHAVDQSVKQWKIARALASKDWNIVRDTLNTLPEHFQVDPGVVFWKTKASMEILRNNILGAKHISAQHVLTVMGELAERRDYYGFLAAEEIGQPIKLRHEPLMMSRPLRNQLRQNKALTRAITLFRFNRTLDARKEWNQFMTTLDEDEQLIAAEIASEAGWHDRPIFTLAENDYLNDVELRFPLAYNTIILDTAERLNLPPSLLFAIARRESSFIADAYSSAGAAGLMQIKPSTASSVRKRRVTKYQLFEPAENVSIGGLYIKQLLRQTDQNLAQAAASYNAGFSKVNSWLPNNELNTMAWIELIPYKETRNYVKAVVAYKQVYQQLLSEKYRDGLTKR